MNRLLAAIANAVRGGRGAAPKEPKAGQLVTPSAAGDLFTGDPSPRRVKSILQAAAGGDPAEQSALFDNMLENDGHLASVWQQRQTALTGLDWELLPANQVGKSPRIKEGPAKKAQEYCLEILAEMTGLEGGLIHLSEAIGRCTAVVELVWERVDGGMRPVAMVPIPFDQLTADKEDVSRLRVPVDKEDTEGLLLDEQPPGKFIVHSPRTLGGNRFRGGLFRGAVLGHMVKRFGRRWWMSGVELFGLPMTIAKYGPNTSSDVKDAMLEMIRDLGVLRGGIFPVGCEIELIESMKSGGALPHERLLRYVDAELSKEFVGQTLTTEIGAEGGSRAAAEVHDDVRMDLTEDDARREGATIREQLLVPLVVNKYGLDAAVSAPYFRRVIEEEKDLAQMALLISTAVNDLGAELPAGVVEDELGLKLLDAKARDKALPGRATGFDPFAGRPTANRQSPIAHRHAGCGCSFGCDDEVVANRVLTDVLRQRKTPIAPLIGWIVAATLASTVHTRNVMASLSSAIEQQPSLKAARDVLPNLIHSLPIEDLVTLETHLLVAGRLAGRVHVRDQVRGRVAHSLVANADTRIDFEAIPFVKAIDSLRDRLGLDPDVFETLDKEARSRAWRVAAVVNMDMLAMIHRELAASIEAGETPRDFRLRLPEMFDRNGWTGENPWHADVVHYQNFVTAHAAGRLSEYQEFEVAGWRYVPSGTSCPICSPLIGKVFAVGDGSLLPPLHFYCDCGDEPVFAEELRPGELQDSSRIDNPALDKEQSRAGGFKWDAGQYANLEPLALSRFSEELRAEFREFGEAHGWEIAV